LVQAEQKPSRYLGAEFIAAALKRQRSLSLSPRKKQKGKERVVENAPGNDQIGLDLLMKMEEEYTCPL